MNEEQYADIRAQLASNSAEHSSFKRRLEEHDTLLREQNKIIVAIEKQGNALETMSKSMNRVETKVNSIDVRVEALEREPGEKWKKTTFEIIKYVILAIAAGIVGYFVK